MQLEAFVCGGWDYRLGRGETTNSSKDYRIRNVKGDAVARRWGGLGGEKKNAKRARPVERRSLDYAALDGVPPFFN